VISITVRQHSIILANRTMLYWKLSSAGIWIIRLIRLNDCAFKCWQHQTNHNWLQIPVTKCWRNVVWIAVSTFWHIVTIQWLRNSELLMCNRRRQCQKGSCLVCLRCSVMLMMCGLVMFVWFLTNWLLSNVQLVLHQHLALNLKVWSTCHCGDISLLVIIIRIIPRQCLWCCHHGRAIARVHPCSFDEWRMAPSGRQPKTKPDDLGCESACTGCQSLHPPSPFTIIRAVKVTC